jgi:hypothetical protein
LARFGFDPTLDWELDELWLIIEALNDLLHAAGWSIEDFRSALGINGTSGIRLTKNTAKYRDAWGGDARTFDPCAAPGASCLTSILDVDFDTISGSYAKGSNAYHQMVKFVFVHELAHVWEQRTGNRGGPRATDMQNAAEDLEMKTGKKQHPAGNPAHPEGKLMNDGSSNPHEDWADAVAATVYPNVPWVRSDWLSSDRAGYVRSQFYAAWSRNHGPNEIWRPGR